MAVQNLKQGFGLGDYKVDEGSVLIADGATITANMSSILAVSLTAESAAGSYVIANFTVSGNVVTVLLSGAASGTAPSTLASSETVHYIIIGQ